MCTVLLRHDPGGPWPLLLAAVRDELLDRPWDPPARHWPDAPDLVGGRDRVSGGTWLAVDPVRHAVAAVLNGPPLPPADRPTRGRLPLFALTGALPADLTGYDTFHLLLATAERVRLWTWDGATVTDRLLSPGDHIVVNVGADATEDPLVPHFAPLLAATRTDVWADWTTLLAGDGLDPADPRALVVRVPFQDRWYGSSSASLVGLGPAGVRYDFAAAPGPAAVWTTVV